MVNTPTMATSPIKTIIFNLLNFNFWNAICYTEHINVLRRTDITAKNAMPQAINMLLTRV